MKKFMIPTASLLWGFHFAFLAPALALLLVTQYQASPSEVGWVLAAYNASGFVAALVLPAWADRHHDYLKPLLMCGFATLGLAAVLWVSTALPVALIGLVLLGGPAGVGVSLMFAQLRHSGASVRDVMNTRALMSFAWVVGPPLATVIIGWKGNGGVLVAIAVVACANIAVTTLMVITAPKSTADQAASSSKVDESEPLAKILVGLVIVIFVILQATNNAGMSTMSLFITERLGRDVFWAGLILGVCAAIEVPMLLAIGRLSERFSQVGLLIAGCAASVIYNAGMAVVWEPIGALVLQVLNAFFFSVLAGIGLTWFQEIIPRPGLAAGIFTNTRRIGSIVSGAVIAFAGMTALGYSGMFALCAALSILALAGMVTVSRVAARA